MSRPAAGPFTAAGAGVAAAGEHGDGRGAVRAQRAPAGATRPPQPAGTATGLVERVQRRLATGGLGAGPGGLRAAVADALRDEGILLPAASFADTVRAISDELTGLGPLGPLLADPAVTDVLVNGPADVWVERDGTIERAPVRFASAAAVAALVQRVVAPLGLRVDEARPWVDARLPGGERFHAVLPPLAPDGPVVTIRTFARRRLSLADLIERGALDAATALLLEAMVAAGVAIAVSGGTGRAWANPQPAETPCRLVLEGGFVVDGGRDRYLEERAGALGFDDLREYLQVRCDTGHSIPRIAAELGVRDWQVRAALSRLPVRLASRPQRLAAQRRQHTEERIAARVIELGFADVRAYLLDRVVERAWLLADVAAELAAHRVTVRRLLDRHGIRRVRRTAAERAAADAGLQVQAVSWQARRTGRLAELGFADLAGYLKARRVEQGWPVRRMRAELQVGRKWLVGELDRLGLRP
jgi:Type II/IV secretion system protein